MRGTDFAHSHPDGVRQQQFVQRVVFKQFFVELLVLKLLLFQLFEFIVVEQQLVVE